MAEPEPTHRKRERHWLRALRPLLWWAILVLLLFAYHTHQRLLEQTRINFTVDLEGKPVEGQASVTLNGLRLAGGERVSLGKHQFAVSHPKAEPISTNLFIWYGQHDLGEISLKRLRGVLALKVEPPAARVAVVGPEFSMTLTNSAGVTSLVPTDVYRVDAHWANHDETKQLTVTSGTMSSLRLAPALGAVSLESNPAGAMVTGTDGRILGTTPLTLPELPPGVWRGELRLDGYIPVPLFLSITASETTSFRTNLVNWQYSQAMESARTYFAAGDYERTLETLSAALKAKPNDPDATALQEKATVAGHLRRTEEMVAAKNYSGARSEANAVLQIIPAHERALSLLNEMAAREQENLKRSEEQAEARRQERLALPKKTFDMALRQYPEASLFDEHELKANLSLIQMESAIRRELETAPAFKWDSIQAPESKTFFLVTWQEVSGGLRRVVIAAAETADQQTHVLFKVMEYKKKTAVTFPGQLTFTTSYVPLDPSKIGELTERQKTQLKEGSVVIEERIRRAVGQKSP